MAATTVLTDGQSDCTFWEVNEEVASLPRSLDVVADVTGAPITYTRTDALTEVPVSGRLKTRAEVDTLEEWIAEQTELYLTARDGSQTTGWRIKAAPAPKIQKKDGDSVDWLVALRLWRLPQ